jgi:hypothetical protein
MIVATGGGDFAAAVGAAVVVVVVDAVAPRVTSTLVAVDGEFEPLTSMLQNVFSLSPTLRTYKLVCFFSGEPFHPNPLFADKMRCILS